MFRKIMASLVLALSVASVAAVPAVANAGDVVWALDVPSSARWDAGFQAYVVEVADASKLAPMVTYKAPVVEHVVSAKFTACPTGTASQPNNGRFCAYKSTGFNGDVYMWNWQWKNTCVPVGGSFDNDVESFAVGFPDQNAQLSHGYNCSLSTAFQTIGPLSNDNDLNPYRNWLSSFFTFD